MSFNLPRPISDKSKTCLLRFQLIENEVRRPNDLDLRLPQALVSDEMARFRMWASNIGAVHDPNRKDTSLDFRLRDSPKIADRVSQFLEDLAQDLHSVLQIASGRRPNQIGALEVHEEPDGTSTLEDPVIVETEHLSEIRELFETCQDCISCLFRLSVAIRKATNRDKYATSARRREDPYDELFDIAHVGHKFPKVRDKQPWLEARLGRAITRRREFLRYSREHEQRLSRGVTRLEQGHTQQVDLKPPLVQGEDSKPLPTVVDAPDQRESTMGSTEVTTLDPALLEAGQQEALEVTFDSEASESSYATTEITAEMEGELKLPPLPEEGEYGKDFDCPYCWITQSFKGKAKRARKQWKEHVLHDLRPYVCTFPHCDLALFSNKDSWFKHELDDHRLEWCCQFCSHAPWETPENYEAHLRNDHANSLKGINLSVILQSSKQSVSTISTSSCPFCDPQVKNESLPLDTFSFKIHAAKHMEQLALFAIPRTSDVGDGSFTSIRAALALPNMNDSIDAEKALANKEPEDLPLHHAAYEGRGVEVKRLLQAGDDVDALGRTWGTPLGAAIEGKHLAVVKLLLESGADTQIPCGKYETALKAASALNNRTLVDVVADAENRNQRPTLYGEIKWKIETISINLERISTDLDRNRSKCTLDGQLLLLGCSLDQEIFSWKSKIIAEHLRPFGSHLDPQSETQAAALKKVIPLVPNLLQSLEVFHDLLSLMVGSLKINAAESASLTPEKAHQISHFNESIVEVLHHIPVPADSWNWRAEKETSLADYFSGSTVFEDLQDHVKRSTKSPREIQPGYWEENCSEFHVFMTRSYEVFSKKLHDELKNKDERLKYFDTYPHEPEIFYRMTEHERSIYKVSYYPTPAEVQKSFFNRSPKLGASKTTPAQLDQIAVPGAGPSDDIPGVPAERRSYPGSETQLLESSVDPKPPGQDQISDLELITEMDADFRRFRESLHTFNDDQLRTVDSIRTLTTKFASEMSKKQGYVLTSALNSIEAATKMTGASMDIFFDHMPKKDWENMNEEERDVGTFDNMPPSSVIGAHIFPIHMTFRILQESFSEASAEKAKDEELPSWTAVMEFFEWKAGYAFDQCLSDCAANLSDMVPTPEKMANADESPLVAVARLKVEQIVADRSQLAASDPGARFRLDQMIEHRNLFSSTGIS